METMLAQAGRTGSAQIGVLVWVVVLIVVLLVGIGMVYTLAKTLTSDSKSSVDSEGLMATMRAMRDRGEMSPEEYDQARKALTRKTVEEVEARLAAKEQAKVDAKAAAASKIIEAGKFPPSGRPGGTHRGSGSGGKQ